jgi:hypothetical protein
MKKIKFILVALVVTLLGSVVCAQDSVVVANVAEVKKGEKVESKGKAIVTVFAGFGVDVQSDVTKCGFMLDRSYVGYQYSLGNGLELKAVMDIGKPNSVDDYHYVAYIKNAQVSWKHEGLTLVGGMISTTQFNMQEKFWGYRYIYKSFQDQYKFGSSADLGISVAYKFTDWVSADAIMTNGEGYKKIQGDKSFQYGLGLTFMPVDGLSVRLYGGLNDATAEGKSDVWNYAAFVGYKCDIFSVGGEFAMMQNTKNVFGDDKLGCSVYGSVKPHKIVDVYARYDWLNSLKSDYNEKDEMVVMVGAQVKLGKYVKVAPNFRLAMPMSMVGGENKYMAYVSCYFGL